MMKKKFSWIRLTELILLLFVMIVVAITVGSADLSVVDSLKILLNKIPVIGDFIDVTGVASTYETIVWNVRLPRILTAAMVGGALAVVGATFQGVFQNSLADPHILGVSSGAALGATIAMLTGASMSFFGLGTLGIFAFIGAMITVFLVYRVAGVGGEISTTNMLLTGTAISTLLSSIISLLMTFNNDQISKVYMWTLGSFASATWEKAGFLAIFVAFGTIILIMNSNKLNILMMGEEDACCLGIDTGKTRTLLIVVSSLLVAACVSVSGIIGFVGLIIPHCIRMVGGSDNRKLMPYAVFIGAIFLVLCDTIARTIAAPTEIPVGTITSVFGAPYFIFLVITRKREF